MHCTDCQHSLDDYLDNLLEDEQRQAMDRHLEHCADCRGFCQSARDLLTQLSALPAPALPADFLGKAITAAQSAQNHRRNRWRTFGLGGALAAGFALVFMSGLLGPRTMTSSAVNQGPTFILTMNQVHKLRMSFTSDKEDDNAEFILRLPEHVSVAGFSGKQEIRWHAAIKSGTNQLVLPLTAHASEVGQLVTEIRTNDEISVFRFHLQTEDQIRTGLLPRQALA